MFGRFNPVARREKRAAGLKKLTSTPGRREAGIRSGEGRGEGVGGGVVRVRFGRFSRVFFGLRDKSVARFQYRDRIGITFA